MTIKKLNFGCGNDLRDGWINADIQEGADVVFDFNTFPYPFKENEFDFIDARQVLQVLDDPDKVLDELNRIAKNGAVVHVETAHYHNKGAHTDIKTKYYFNEYSFRFYVEHPCDIKRRGKYKIKLLWLEPTWIGNLLIFEKARKFFNNFLSGIYSKIHVKLEVVK